MTPATVQLPTPAFALYSGTDHVCALLSWEGDGMYCWGRNDAGQLGAGHITGGRSTQHNSPVKVDFGALKSTRIWDVTLSTGSQAGSTCILHGANKLVMCWGENKDGQLGYGDRTDRAKPTGENLYFGP